MDGRPLDLGKPVPHQTLGVIRNLLEHEPIVAQGLTPLFPHDWRWLVGQLPAQLETLAALRNPAAHSEVLGRDPAVELRNNVLGVGGEGLVVQIARARMRRAREDLR